MPPAPNQQRETFSFSASDFERGESIDAPPLPGHGHAQPAPDKVGNGRAAANSRMSAIGIHKQCNEISAGRGLIMTVPPWPTPRAATTRASATRPSSTAPVRPRGLHAPSAVAQSRPESQSDPRLRPTTQPGLARWGARTTEKWRARTTGVNKENALRHAAQIFVAVLIDEAVAVNSASTRPEYIESVRMTSNDRAE
jgi:hypothetical protein